MKGNINSYVLAISVSAIAWSLLQVGHEILGHGSMVLIVGAEPVSVNAMYFEHNLEGISSAGVKWIQAAGSLFNIILALTALLLLRISRNLWLSYFLWVTVLVNLFQSGSYIAFGRFIHEGMDWAQILTGVSNRPLWEIMELVGGASLLLIGVIVGRRHQNLFTNSTELSSRSIYFIPLFISTALSVSSSLIMPTDDRFMMIMGGIGNGFSFLILLLVLGLLRAPRSGSFPSLGHNQYRAVWMTLAILITFFYLAIMSPGIDF